MHRLLLVEDNARDVRIIRETVDFEGLDIEVVGIATDGEEALGQVDLLSPDLLLSDISMPVMNGLEMAERLRSRHPEIRIVFMSSYDEFTFAQTAVELMVCGYVLKPIDPYEIEKALKKAVGLQDARRREEHERESLLQRLEASMPVLREQFLRELLIDPPQSAQGVRERMLFLRMDMACAQFVVMSLETRESPGALAADRYLREQSIAHALTESGDGFTALPVRLTAAETAVLLFFSQANPSLCMNDALEYAARVRERLLSMGVTTTPSLSNPTPSPAAIPELLLQAQRARRALFFSGDSPIVLYSDIEDMGSNPLDEEIDLSALQTGIADRVLMGDDEDALAFLEELFSRPGMSEPHTRGLAYAIVTILQLQLIQKRAVVDIALETEGAMWRRIETFQSANELQDWLRSVLLGVRRGLSALGKERNAAIVARIQEIVKQRYATIASVAEIAREVYLSSKQANAIFRTATGQTIFDCLTMTRMEEAKRRLKAPDSRVFWVAEEVGYQNKSHFSLLFKRYTGLSPQEYKTRSVL